jgi:hypothetical protein
MVPLLSCQRIARLSLLSKRGKVYSKKCGGKRRKHRPRHVLSMEHCHSPGHTKQTPAQCPPLWAWMLPGKRN